MKKKFFTKKRLKKGATTMIEIVLIVAVIILVCVTAMTALGKTMSGKFGEIEGVISGSGETEQSS